jgi:hypothetical protein
MLVLLLFAFFVLHRKHHRGCARKPSQNPGRVFRMKVVEGN